MLCDGPAGVASAGSELGLGVLLERGAAGGSGGAGKGQCALRCGQLPVTLGEGPEHAPGGASRVGRVGRLSTGCPTTGQAWLLKAPSSCSAPPRSPVLDMARAASAAEELPEASVSCSHPKTEGPAGRQGCAGPGVSAHKTAPAWCRALGPASSPSGGVRPGGGAWAPLPAPFPGDLSPHPPAPQGPEQGAQVTARPILEGPGREGGPGWT